MNKGDLIEVVARRTGESKAQAGRAIEAVLASIAEGVATHGKVTISGFGSFEKKSRAGRSGVNPVTKERILIEPTVTIGFRPSPLLRESLEETETEAAAGVEHRRET